VPELVWASLSLIAAGLGPFAGTLALAARMAGVVGVVGAGGLGQVRALHMGPFHMNKTATVLISMLLLVGLVDALSSGLRRLLTR
jgi:ABC-type phosphate/phosphonate transport system permease subunit